MYRKVRLALMACLAVAVSGCIGGGGDDSPDIFFVDALGILRKIDLSATAQIDSAVAITGLQVGETIVGMDFRPSTNQLFAIGSTDRLYTINLSTGAATQVGAVFATPLASLFAGMDFNPVADRIRVVTDGDLNMRVNPDDGTIVVDTALNPAGGDVVAAAYTNNSPAAIVTTLYAIDAVSDNLVRIGGVNGTPSPNGGVVTNVGPLGTNVSAAVNFDIDADGNAIMIATSAGPTNDVYTVNLLNGNATIAGQVNGFNITAMAVRP